MLVAIIILSILLFFALTFIIVLGIDEGWHGDEWLATFLFIFLSPIWLVAKLVVNIKGNKRDSTHTNVGGAEVVAQKFYEAIVESDSILKAYTK